MMPLYEAFDNASKESGTMFHEIFIKQYVGYATHHQDHRNEITHFIGVPPIFMSVIFLLSGSVFRFGDLQIMGIPISIGLIFFCLLAASWIALDIILGGIVFLLMLPVLLYSPSWADAVEAGSVLGIWGVVLVFVSVQIFAWSFQILGHVFEGRRPRILENFFQSTLAMMFLVQIVFNVFGWRPKLQQRIDVELERWNAERGLIKGKLPHEANG